MAFLKVKSKDKEYVEKNYSNVQPLWHFIILCVISFGIYELYWFYKNWNLVKEHYSLKIYPLIRSLLFVIFTYSLFKKILSMAKEKGYAKHFMPAVLAVSYIVLSLLSRLDFPYLYLSLFSFVPLIPILNAVNYYWEKEQPHKKVRTSFVNGEIIFILIFGVLFILNMKVLIFG